MEHYICCFVAGPLALQERAGFSQLENQCSWVANRIWYQVNSIQLCISEKIMPNLSGSLAGDRSQISWFAPSYNFVKLNCDGSVIR